MTQPVDGGVAVCVRQLAEAAVAAGHAVVVASPDKDGDAFAAAVTIAGARHVTMLDATRRPQWGDGRSVVRLRQMMENFDVVHLHSSKAGAVGRLAAAFLGRHRPKVVFTPHAWSWLVGGRLAVLYRLTERILAPFCDVIVAVSSEEAVQGVAVLGRAGHRITLIENGVDRTQFSPEGPAAPRDKTVPLIVCVGRLTHQKGQDVALRALAAMRTASARLRLVGAGDAEDSLAALARELGIGDRVEWTGFVTDTAPHFRAADVVVSPSRWEGLSLVFLEAMASGAPLVASAVQGSEIIGDGGVVVPPDDHRALAAALDALLEDKSRRGELRRRARERSRDYDVGVTLARNLDLWQALARKTPPR